MQPARLAGARRIGIMGGTFDPIHYGHLAIAEEARDRYRLEAVLFVPTGEPPHKPLGRADAEHRYRMTLLATADHPDFFVSRMEIDRSGPSYTVDTLRALHTAYPAAELYLILGADMALYFPHWREPHEILAQARVVAATRPGFSLEQLREIWEEAHLGGPDVMPTPGLDIASTALRERVRAGRSIRYLTPDAVCAFIAKYGLYRDA